MTSRSKRSTILNSRLGYLTQALGGNNPIGENDPESEAETCPSIGGFVMNLIGNRGELEVYLTAETAMYDENGQLILPENLGDYIGDVVRTRGDFTAEDQYEASLVVIGPVLALEGMVESEVVENQFTLDIVPGEGFTGFVLETCGDMIYDYSAFSILV